MEQMTQKYDSLIDLTPGMESVVSIGVEARDHDFWSRYIVNQDIVTAIDLLGRTLRPTDVSQDVWHLMVQGAYGTGKTYISIVLKHLLEDDYSVVESFLKRNPLFADVREKFLAARKKGHYYVDFRSGECKQLTTANFLLFQLEKSVRRILEKYHFAYTGTNSVIDQVIAKVKDFRPVLEKDFDNGLYDEYWGAEPDFNTFFQKVISRNADAISAAHEILRQKDIGLATDIDSFKRWMQDIFNGNQELAKTGIFIIWDEFTDYIRFNDLDVIQQLSLMSKDLPFYIIYVIHEYPGVFSENVSKNKDKADARFHRIPVSLSDKTTFKLIGESICVRDGMATQWADICDVLYESLGGYAHLFMGDPGDDLDAKGLKKIFPIHPMTVNLVTKVAGLSASNRSIFQFLKSNDEQGFRAFIHRNGRYDWRWVTPDYLWDYFFVSNAGGKKEMSQTAEDCLKHYNKIAHTINDVNTLRVFKAALLLLATIGSGRTMKKSKGAKGIQATEKTLMQCFCGQLTETEVSQCLDILRDDSIHALSLANDGTGDRRIELPYAGSGDELDKIIAELKEKKPMSLLLSEGEKGCFGDVLKKQFFPDERAVMKRVVAQTCWYTTQQINLKFDALKQAIEGNKGQFGVLLVVTDTSENVAKARDYAEQVLHDRDTTGRIIICVLEYVLDKATVEQWYNLIGQSLQAAKTGSFSVNADSLKSDADDVVSLWVASAKGKGVFFLYRDGSSKLPNNSAALSTFERRVFEVYPAAPETIAKKNTLYKGVSAVITFCGAARVTKDNFKQFPGKVKSFDTQWQDVVDILQEHGIWGIDDIEALKRLDDSRPQRSIAALCKLIDKELSSGTVFLSELWETVQDQLGYYNAAFCGYLLGFVLRFYVGRFTWHDGSNPFKLEIENIPSVVQAMLSGKAAGMRLASESETEKRFEDISRRIFALSTDETADISKTRTSIKIWLDKFGYPIWLVKWVDASLFAGQQEDICAIIDLLVDFILEKGNQGDVINEITNLIKKNPKAYINVFKSILTDKANLASALRSFVYANSDEAESVCNRFGYQPGVLKTGITRILEEEVWQWREAEVSERIQSLILDLRLIGIINEALNSSSATTVEKIRDILANKLAYCKVPGVVMTASKQEWSIALGYLHDISENRWVGYSNEKKAAILSVLENHAQEALEIFDNPISVLKAYIIQRGMGTLTEDDYNKVLYALNTESYQQTEATFKQEVRRQISHLEYTRQVEKLKTIWKTKTQSESLQKWTAIYQTPATWVVPEYAEIIGAIMVLESNEHLDMSRLESAIVEAENADFSRLMSIQAINDAFLDHVSPSEKVKPLLQNHIMDIKQKIQNAGFTSPAKWDSSIVAIRRLVDTYLSDDIKAEVGDKAKAICGDQGPLRRRSRNQGKDGSGRGRGTAPPDEGRSSEPAVPSGRPAAEILPPGNRKAQRLSARL